MVLQRTIENLRERSKHEKEAVAFWTASIVVVVLLVGWAIFFFRSVSIPDLQPVNTAYNQVVQQVSASQSALPSLPDTTGWVSAQTDSAGADVQLIQEGEVDASANVTQ